MTFTHRNDADAPPQALLYVITAAAVLLGLWGRFKGLGAWPLNSDEYYIARSVEDILRTGLPGYDCGGYYIRGLAFQYVVASLQMAGMSAELSARFVAAVCSLIALPAVYLLGRRVSGRAAGLLAVSVMALSVWEVDIARFGRMYAPFQAVFVWYLVFFLRFAVDRDVRARTPMLLLSVLGVLTWEGGILLMASNLLPPLIWKPNGRFTRPELRYLLQTAGLLVLAFLATRAVDFRTFGTDPFPADYLGTGDHGTGDNVRLVQLMPSSFGWITAYLGLVVLTLGGLRWAWSFRNRWPTALGLLIAMAGALAHQFAAVAFVLVTLLLVGMLHWRELVTGAAAPFGMLLAASAAAWTAVALGNPDWLASLETPWNGGNRGLALVYEFLRLPDFLGVVVLPWARSAPALGAILLALLTLASLRVIALGQQPVSDERVILLLMVCLIAAASLSDPPRFETRYVFFLYPAAIVVAIAVVARAVALASGGTAASHLATAMIIAAGFYFTGDLQPRRLLTIDSAEHDSDLPAGMGGYSNVLNRSDPRGAAEWLATNADSPGTVVINGHPGVDYYYSEFDFAYIDKTNQRYWAYACKRGTVERWGNLPLLSSAAELNSKIAASQRVMMPIDTRSLEALLPRLDVAQPRIAWVSADGYISIVEFSRTPTGG